VVAATLVLAADEAADVPAADGAILPELPHAAIARTAAVSTAMETPLFAERMMISPQRDAPRLNTRNAVRRKREASDADDVHQSHRLTCQSPINLEDPTVDPAAVLSSSGLQTSGN